MTIDKCCTCIHAFTTGKERWYCKKFLADKDDCGEYEMTIGKYEMTIEEVNENLHDIKTDAIYQITSKEKEAIDIAIETMRKYQKIQELIAMDDENHRRTIRLADLKEVIEDGNDE